MTDKDEEISKKPPMTQFPDRSPTWWEGYWAHAMGWPLYNGHTAQYEAGWRYRAKVMR